MNIERKTAIGLATAAVAFFVSTAALIYTTQQFIDASNWVARTYKVIGELKDSLNWFLTLESNARGFQITGDERYSTGFLEARQKLFERLDVVYRMNADNPTQQLEVAKLKDIAIEKVTFNQTAIQKRGLERSVDPALVMYMSGRGKQLTEMFRKQLDVSEEIERSLLARRVKRLLEVQQQTWISMAVLSVLGFCALGWVSFVNRSFIRAEQRNTEELTKVATQLRRSNEDLQQFAYVASHDLQEPLRAVVGFLTLLDRRLEKQLDAESREWLNHAVDGGQRMRSLINDLLAFSRVDSQGQQLVDNVSLDDVISAASTNLRVAIDESGATIKSANLPKVTGDKMQLIQLFQNLIGNAIKYRHPTRTPVVEVGARREPGRWVISVKDNGIGFDMEHSQRIFVIFQRLHSRGDHPGTGIGLALCKRIVERHSGEIWCESVLDQGSTFFVALPIST